MPQWLLLILALFTPVVSAAADPDWVALHGPATADLGRLPVGLPASRRVVVLNTSDRRVTIDIESKSCGCITAVVEPTEIAPGEVASIRFETTVQHVAGEQLMGVTVRARPTGKTVEARAQRINLTMRYTPRVDYRVMPEQIVASAEAGRRIRLRLFVQDVSDGALHIGRVSSDIPGVDVRLDPEPAPRHPRAPFAHRAVLADWTPERPGTWRGSVFIETDSDAMPRVRIPLVIRVRSACEASPPGIVLRQDAAGGRHVVRLSGIGGSRARDLTAKLVPEHAGLSAMLEGDDAGSCVLTVLAHDLPSGPWEGCAVIHRGDEEIAFVPVVWVGTHRVRPEETRLP